MPPHASQSRQIVGQLLKCFALFGYQEVNPPLMEFEESLLAGKGKAHEHNTFRVMDPHSHKMMGVRADMTTQLERIATIMHGSDSNHPVRLSYSGSVLRVSPPSLSPTRQMQQTGIEMIGYSKQISSVEILTVLLEALLSIGVTSPVISLSVAGITDTLFGSCIAPSREMIDKAILHKDKGTLPETMPYRDLISDMMILPFDQVTARHDFPEIIAGQLHMMQQVRNQIQEQFKDGIDIYCDPLDMAGFSYHDGLCFTLFDADTAQEIGRGGHYTIDETLYGCGATLYTAPVIDAVKHVSHKAEVQYVSRETPYADIKALHNCGITTLFTQES